MTSHQEDEMMLLLRKIENHLASLKKRSDSWTDYLIVRLEAEEKCDSATAAQYERMIEEVKSWKREERKGENGNVA